MGISLDRANFSSIGVAGTPGPHGFAIREKRSGDPKFPTPTVLTMMVLYFDTDNRLTMRTHSTDCVVDEYNCVVDIESDELWLFKDIMRETGNKSYIPQAPGHIVFPGPCFFTIVVNVKNWEFLYSEEYEDYDQFVFTDQKSHLTNVENSEGKTIKDVQEITNRYARNYSFFDAEETFVGGMSAVRCINYCKKNASGDNLEKGEVRLYGFNMYLTVPLTELRADEPRTVIIIDPTGENKGPPVGGSGPVSPAI